MQAGGRGAGEAWQVVSRQPGWITRAVLTLFMLLIALPFLALFVLAIIGATLLFLVLAAVNMVLGSIRSLLGGGGPLAGPGAAADTDADAGAGGQSRPRGPRPRDGRDGRENVRVIRRD